MEESTTRGRSDAGTGTVPGWWAPSAWGVFAFAIAVRAAWAAVVPIEPVSDSGVYDQLARSIADGSGYAFVPGQPTAYWPVGTSAMYAVVYAIFGAGYGPAAALNVIVGAGCVGLTMLLAREWFGPRAALAAGLILAAWPGQVTFASVLASELPFNLCWLAALYAATRPGLHPAARAAMAGVALAGASYIRPVALLLPAVFAWIRLIGPGGPALLSRRSATIVAEAAGATAVMVALILPWTLRNERAFGRPVPISANGGANLWMGNNPDTKGGYMPLPGWVEGMDEASRDAALKEIATGYIRERPGAFVVRTLVKLLQTHDRETIGVHWNGPGLERAFGPASLTPLKVLSTAYWLSALAMGLAGALAALRRLGPRRWLGQPAVVLWAYFATLHAVIVSGDRYHYPSVPLIAALAGLGVVALIDLARRPGRDGCPRA